MATPDIVLVLGDEQATVSQHGGRVTSYRVGERDVLAGQEHPAQFAYRGALLAPWPNRVAQGRWTWRGQELQLHADDPTGVDAALHGLIVHAPFTVCSQSLSAARLVHDLKPSPGYPFLLRVEVEYSLGPDGLACSLTAVNTGREDAPVGLGVHPYVASPTLVDDLVLTLPARTALEVDSHWRESGRRPAAEVGLDFTRPSRLGAREIDAAFTDLTVDPDGRVRVRFGLPEGGEVVLWSGATCRWLVVYTGHTLMQPDWRRCMAVEPMTCPPNGLASGEIDVLGPGQELRLDWGFSSG